MRELIGGGPPPVIQEVSMRQLRAQHSLSLYADQGLASPDLAIADQRVEFKPRVVGEDGQEMTFERRQQLMAGRPTLKQIADEVKSTGKSVDEVYDYTKAPIDITIERLGKAAEAARAPWRVVKAEPAPEPQRSIDG